MAGKSESAADGEAGDAIDLAAQRLERALALLEGRVKTLSTRAEESAGGLFDFDRSKLAAELDSARAREKQLHAAGTDASEALGRAIAGIRAALAEAEEG
jgi:hypothetical protein